MSEEIVDGVLMDKKRIPSVLRGPKEGNPGWAGRIYNATMQFITSDEKELQKIEGIGMVRARRMVSGRDRNVKFLKEGRWEGFVNFSREMQRRVIRENSVKMMGDADKMVTIDTSRLIRLPNTLHGGSGLIAKTIEIDKLEDFNPLIDAVAFSDTLIKIRIDEKIPEFEMNEQKFSPFKQGTVKMPEYAAVYLLLRGSASIT
ncbi:MAG TPA: hypothetical protein EYP86_02140 [Candidatus Altiarchaeales archaeon]|nr:hypothetical protein [Candidatus Altiarchaeales archaeon]